MTHASDGLIDHYKGLLTSERNNGNISMQGMLCYVIYPLSCDFTFFLRLVIKI